MRENFFLFNSQLFIQDKDNEMLIQRDFMSHYIIFFKAKLHDRTLSNSSIAVSVFASRVCFKRPQTSNRMSCCSEFLNPESDTSWEYFIVKLQKDFEISEEDIRNETWLQSKELDDEQESSCEDEIVLYEDAISELANTSEAELIIKFHELIRDKE